jgi:aspartyl protease family protein
MMIYVVKFEAKELLQRFLAGFAPEKYFIHKKKEREVVIYKNSNGHFYVTVNIKGKDLKFMIDTGATISLLTSKDAKEVGIDLESLDYDRFSVTAAGPVKTARYKLDIMKIFKQEMHDIRFTIHKNQYIGDVNLLGMNVISRFKNFTINDERLIIRY